DYRLSVLSRPTPSIAAHGREHPSVSIPLRSFALYGCGGPSLAGLESLRFRADPIGKRVLSTPGCLGPSRNEVLLEPCCIECKSLIDWSSGCERTAAIPGQPVRRAATMKVTKAGTARFHRYSSLPVGSRRWR